MITRRALALGLPLGWAAGWAGPGLSQNLRADEHVLFAPTYARDLPEGLELSLEVWVFEYERRRGARSAFARFLGVDLDGAPTQTQQIFNARSTLFLTDSERGKQVGVNFMPPAQGRVVLPATNRAGRAGARVMLPKLPADKILFHTDAVAGQSQQAMGAAIVVPETGLSVVSDIDDTIKLSQVGDRRALLLNTFMRPFASVPGMAEQFQRLSGQAGTRFHYLSSSPIQLLPALQQFLHEAGFPMGSMHLRESTSWDRLVPRKGETQSHKKAMLNRILADFPKREFLFLGDSGEHDPEIYADIARAYAGRKITILIRDLGDQGRGTARYQQAFAGLPAQSWHLLLESGGGWAL